NFSAANRWSNQVPTNGMSPTSPESSASAQTPFTSGFEKAASKGGKWAVVKDCGSFARTPPQSNSYERRSANEPKHRSATVTNRPPTSRRQLQTPQAPIATKQGEP